MPVFKRVHGGIANALNSLLTQSFPGTSSSLFSDNASSDDTEAICRRRGGCRRSRALTHRNAANIGVLRNYKPASSSLARPARTFKWGVLQRCPVSTDSSTGAWRSSTSRPGPWVSSRTPKGRADCFGRRAAKEYGTGVRRRFSVSSRLGPSERFSEYLNRERLNKRG